MNKHISPAKKYDLVKTVEIKDTNQFEEIFESAMKRDFDVQDADDFEIGENGQHVNPKCGYVVFSDEGAVWYWIDFDLYMKSINFPIDSPQGGEDVMTAVFKHNDPLVAAAISTVSELAE